MSSVQLFLAFAFANFISALVRSITATLSPTFSAEFALQAGDLGLLAGGYFLGFAITQLPLGTWLDRHGPKRVVLSFLAIAVLGSLAFSMADGLGGLLASRVLTGVGVSACLMAPLTGYRRWFSKETQLRANSWMLMTGSLGTVASTLPVQWLLPVVGWRPLFWAMALLLVVAMGLIAWLVPRWDAPAPAPASGAPLRAWQGLFKGYGQVWRHPYFRRMTPLGFFSYGGLLAMQTLWVGPWLVRVAGQSPLEAARGLFWLNVVMLLTFWSWGLVNPLLSRRGLHADRLIAWGLPLSFVALGWVLWRGADAGAPAWTLYCMACTFVSLSQPAVGMAFPGELAGRALSAYNLVIFAGVFVVQWAVGLMVDGFAAAGLDTVNAFRAALAAFLVCGVASWLFFLRGGPHNRAS